jgi:hypothetical protein
VYTARTLTAARTRRRSIGDLGKTLNKPLLALKKSIGLGYSAGAEVAAASVAVAQPEVQADDSSSDEPI